MPEAGDVVSVLLEYDGTNYVGWQVQPNGTSIQSVLEAALAELCGQPVRVTGSGRTDSGVHALGQVASFVTPVSRPLKAFHLGLNTLLPYDIAVREAVLRPPSFDARRSARGKLYRYTVHNTPQRAPLTARSSWQVYPALDVAAMREGARHLLGTHDFAAYRASNCAAKTTVRTLKRLDILGEPRGLLQLEVEATAFLKHMVRNLVGTLVEVGLGKRPPASVAQALASLDRNQAGRTAPPQGLCLVQVHYPESPASPPAKDAEDDGDDD
jgi:tRNA pseudouridine38-40 synthase